jgi:hypothetical protein
MRAGLRQEELSVSEFIDFASVTILEEVAPEMKPLARDLFYSSTAEQFRAAMEAIHQYARSMEQGGAGAGQGALGPATRNYNNRAEATEMLDDDDWFSGDADAMALRDQVVAQRNAGTYVPPKDAGPATSINDASGPVAVDAAAAEWLSVDD